MKWNSQLYDSKHDYVSEYGKALLDFIPIDSDQTILDLGCGTGVLTAQLGKIGNRVIGVDSSQSMIGRAKKQFQSIEFMLCDALDLPFEDEFDVVFSNAVFHWISDHDTLLKSIRKVLKAGGTLVCEFGAAGNIKTIDDAFSEQAALFGYSCINKFNFPSVETFSKALERNQFVIESIYDYDRPTPLNDGEKGLKHFLKQFYATELERIPEAIQEKIINGTEDRTRMNLWDGSRWVADYRRLRAIAHI